MYIKKEIVYIENDRELEALLFMNNCQTKEELKDKFLTENNLLIKFSYDKDNR